MPIENWELRRQAKEIVHFIRRLAYCLKGLCYERRLFWGYCYSCLFGKYCAMGFWDGN